MIESIKTENYIIDASVAIKLYKEEEDSEAARKLFSLAREKKVKLYAPDMIIYEVADKLREIYSENEAFEKMKSFIEDYMHEIIPIFRKAWEWGVSSTGEFDLFSLPNEGLRYKDKDLLDAIEIAKGHNIPFYDASYIALAKNLN
jgi:predicted nucleic acid-binding protein